MVLPLAALMAVGGAGMQMYGQDQRSGAQDAALAKLRYAQKFNAAGGEYEQDLTNQSLGNLGEQWTQSSEQAVGDLSAENMRGAFGAGEQGVQDRIGAVLGATPQAGADAMQASGQNVAFQNAQARTKLRNNIQTDALRDVLAKNEGMGSMNEHYRKGRSEQGDRNMMIQRRIQDILRLQNYADGVRNAALQRAGSEHSLDQARAASVGSGAMYLGALMGGASGLANMGGQGSTALGGVDGPANPNSTLNPGSSFPPHYPTNPQV